MLRKQKTQTDNTLTDIRSGCGFSIYGELYILYDFKKAEINTISNKI